jgi:putative transposase
MVRSLRIEYAGAWYHVMNRGLEYRNIFLKDNHRKLFLDLLSEISQRFKIEIHSYCLMDNHYHLLLQSKLPNLNLAMKHLNGVYTLRFNRDVKRDGPLFRRRYKSILIDKDEYFLNVNRYIHKNPSAAKVIKDDKRYPWSSYRYYNLDKDDKPSWLFADEAFSYFNGDESRYNDFVEGSVDENTKKFYLSPKIKSIIGGEAFIKEISDKFSKGGGVNILNNSQIIAVNYPSLEEIAKKVSCKYEIDLDLILNNSSRNSIFERNLLIYLFMLNPRYKTAEKAEFLAVDSAAILKGYKRFVKKMGSDERIREEVRVISDEIYAKL